MTDKYEEFKEWFKKNSHRYGVWKIDDNGNQEIYHYSRAFMDFEKEQTKKRKEEEIKTIVALEISDYSSDYSSDTVKKKVDSIYKKLKERDLIK